MNEVDKIILEVKEAEAKENVNEHVESVERRDNSKGAEGDFGSGLLIGGITVALIATGAWALSKDSVTGEVRASNWFKKNDVTVEDDAVIVNDEENEVVSQEQAPGFVYDYENNVVIVKSNVDPRATYAYDFQANAANDTTYMDENGNLIPVITEAGQVITNPIVNTELPSNLPYVELTNEKFEELTTNLILELEGYGLQVSREDVIKYAMIRNIDKLKQDNNELIAQILGDQNVFEFITDACHVIDAIRNYNLLYFDNYHTTDGFISVADGVFDEVQRARAIEFERRVYELANYYLDDERYNELTYTLLRDLLNPLNPISQLEDGVSYGMELVDMHLVRTRFSQDKTGGFNDVNADLIQYFVSFPEDDEEHSNNALMNGNVSNIIRLLSECEVKTLTK